MSYTKIIPKPAFGRHKGDLGRIGIIGGCSLYTGAPYYAGIAALRCGADLCTIFTSPDAAVPIKTYSPELMVVPDYKPYDWLNRLHVLIIGPGLGREESTCKLVRDVMTRDVPMVIDADGLWAVLADLSVIRNSSHVILTPNAPEFARLLEAAKTQGIVPDSACTPEDLATALRCTIVLKGNHDKICNEHITLTCDELGIPRRCGGQGDILAGLAGTFLHWAIIANVEHPTIDAALAATTLLKRSANLAYHNRGMSTLTTDIIEHINCKLL